MQTHRNPVSRRLAAAAIGAALITAATPTWSQTATPGDAAAKQEHRREHLRQHLQERLDRMAKRLEITAAQQAAWDAYAAVVLAAPASKPQRPGPDADAAAIMHFRADIAAAGAQKLARIADATGTLQQALTPDQRQLLAKFARHGGRHGGHHRLWDER